MDQIVLEVGQSISIKMAGQEEVGLIIVRSDNDHLDIIPLSNFKLGAFQLIEDSG